MPRSARYFSRADRLEQRRRDDEPAEPQRGRERLARRAGVGDAVGFEALQRADRRAVVAVLGVVVVLDGEGVAVAQPGEQRGAALGGEDGAGRVLVGGGEDDGVFVARAPRTRRPSSSTAIGTGSRPARRAISSCSGLPGPRSRCGGRRRRRARGRRGERLGVAARDHDARGVGDHAADAAEVVGERLRGASRGRSSRRTGGRRRASSRAPRGSRAARRRAGSSRRRGRWGGSRSAGAAAARAPASARSRRPRRVGHARARALPQAQVALGGELAVGVDHHAARDAELAGEVARGRDGARRACSAPCGSPAAAPPRSGRRACRRRPSTPRGGARAADWSRSKPRNWIFHVHQLGATIAACPPSRQALVACSSSRSSPGCRSPRSASGCWSTRST